MQEFLKRDSEGHIVEYPVFETHIRNRGLRLDMFVPVMAKDKPRFNADIDFVRKATPQADHTGTFYQNWEIKPLNDTAVKTNLKNALANVRWMHETGGVQVGPVKVKTDRESQATINATFVSLSEGLVPDADFKAVDGWTTVDLTTLRPVAEAVAKHVQRCFKAERNVEAAIELLEGEALRSVSVKALYDAEYAVLANA